MIGSGELDEGQSMTTLYLLNNWLNSDSKKNR
jgi:hypothetical protein